MSNASPGDIRNDLDPTVVDVVADQIHALSCLVIGAPPRNWPDDHRVADRSKARFVMMGLRDRGYEVRVR